MRDSDNETEQVRVVGWMQVQPPLNTAEYAYLSAFAESRRWQRPGGPYEVPDHPVAEWADPELDVDAYTTPAAGQPGLACPWLPTGSGAVLSPVAVPTGLTLTATEVLTWLGYLRDHFLTRAGRLANEPNRPAEFDGFTFDHVIDGAAAACEPTAGCLVVARMSANVLEIEQLCTRWKPAWWT